MHRSVAAIAIAVTALLGLTACTGSPGAQETAGSSDAGQPPSGDGQSVAQACSLIQETITDATAEFNDASTDDPAAAVESMKSAAEKLADAAGQITNPDVAAVLPDLQDMFATTADAMQSLAEGDLTKLDDLAAVGQEFQETSERFQELCTT